jgi:superfamily II DNA/RNA helicase
MLSATFDNESLDEIKNEFMGDKNCLVRAGAVNQVINTITQKILKVCN